MMQFIHENYRRNLSLDEIAAQSMISKSSALNLFRSYLHITPVNYLINYRLKQAALLLSHTEKKVSTISAETGFHNVDYFCRAFKKHYQVTPGEYRKKSGINRCYLLFLHSAFNAFTTASYIGFACGAAPISSASVIPYANWIIVPSSIPGSI